MGAPRGTNRDPTDESGTAAVLRAVIETSDDAIFTVDPAGRVSSWATKAERLFGRPGIEVLERDVDTLFPPHLRRRVSDLVARVLAGETITHVDSEIVRADGMPMPVWVSLCPVVVDDGTPPGAVVIARDITEQRLAQAALAEVESRLEEAETLARVGSWLWDLRTDAVQWSTEFHRIHGIDPVEFDGTLDSHIRLVHPDDRAMVRSAMHGAVVSARPLDCRYRVRCPDGQIRTVHVRAQPAMGSAGAPIGLRGIGREVAEDLIPGRPAP
jgi:PAS domain S-box-containing protein